MFFLKYKRAWSAFAGIGLAALAYISPLQAATSDKYPSAPIVLVVPYAPGGTTDIVGRIVASELGKVLGQTVVVENKAGAGGTVGTDYGSRQRPDGYTLIMGNIGPIATSPSIYKNLPYDPIKDLISVRNIIGIPNAIMVPANSPLKTIGDLLKYKGKPLFYATPGASTSPHLTAEMFAMQTGVPLEHVPYKGSGPALTDLIAGHIPLMFDNLPSAMALLQAGTIRALAVTTENRLPLLPNVPTLVESGLDGFVVTGWSGIFVPAKTPEAIVKQLYSALDGVMHDASVRKRIGALAAEMPESNPEDFKAFVRSETDRWREVVKKANITSN